MSRTSRFRALAAGLAVAGLLLARRWCNVVTVRGHSMSPTLTDGQRVLAIRRGRYRTGEVIVFWTPGGSGAARRTRAPRTVPIASVIEPVEIPDVDISLLRTRVPGKLGAVISPLVRRMNRDHGVEHVNIHGYGESGMIMRRDVEDVSRTPVEEWWPE